MLVHTVVEEDISLLELSKHTLLFVLLDRIAYLVGGNLKLFAVK